MISVHVTKKLLAKLPAGCAHSAKQKPAKPQPLERVAPGLPSDAAQSAPTRPEQDERLGEGQGLSLVAANAPEAAPSAGYNPLDNWHANLLTIQRRNCVLLVHDATRFPLFIPALTKPDFAKLEWHFQDCLINTLLKSGFSAEQINRATELLAPLRIDSDCNRSVQGTLNQMKGDIEHLIWHDQVNVADCAHYRLSAWLANRPCKVQGHKDYIKPQQAMAELLTKEIG
ncbi:DUF6933 domain-containing protein [Aliagarivorans taiwanensis]|uniref:DUF6933 domain-containing protein n=1 Tax=Aliagarivorans taiwanensis TaxID=561966 RepID=UPI0004055D98|nr:hypothetical protein [Aliagarivorans taiwanensis]